MSMMNHARVKALKGQGKTTSRKAVKSGRASANLTPGSSPMASLLTSPNHSAGPSRATSDVSDDEDDGEDYDLEDMMASTISGGSGADFGDDSGTFDAKALIEEFQDHKNRNAEAREQMLELYIRTLRTRYTPEGWKWLDESGSELAETFLRDASRSNESLEQLLCLKAYCLTLGSSEEVDTYQAGSKILKMLLQDSEDIDTKAYAIYALAMTVLYGGGSEEAAQDFMSFLVEVVESDGARAEAHDEGTVVAAALRAWSFVASHVGDYSEHADTAMEAFVDQLESSDVEVQSQAATCIALIFESSRQHEQENGEPFDLQYDPQRLTGRIGELVKLSVKATSRRERRDLKESLASVVTSLERGVGPYYSTATYVPEKGERVPPEQRTADGTAEYGYRLKIKLGGAVAKIDSWSLYSRWMMLKIIFRGGLQNHAMRNPVVMECIEDAEFDGDQNPDDGESPKGASKGRRR